MCKNFGVQSFSNVLDGTEVCDLITRCRNNMADIGICFLDIRSQIRYTRRRVYSHLDCMEMWVPGKRSDRIISIADVLQKKILTVYLGGYFPL